MGHPGGYVPGIPSHWAGHSGGSGNRSMGLWRGWSMPPAIRDSRAANNERVAICGTTRIGSISILAKPALDADWPPLSLGSLCRCLFSILELNQTASRLELANGVPTHPHVCQFPCRGWLSIPRGLSKVFRRIEISRALHCSILRSGFPLCSFRVGRERLKLPLFSCFP